MASIRKRVGTTGTSLSEIPNQPIRAIQSGSLVRAWCGADPGIGPGIASNVWSLHRHLVGASKLPEDRSLWEPAGQACAAVDRTRVSPLEASKGPPSPCAILATVSQGAALGCGCKLSGLSQG